MSPWTIVAYIAVVSCGIVSIVFFERTRRLESDGVSISKGFANYKRTVHSREIESAFIRIDAFGSRSIIVKKTGFRRPFVIPLDEWLDAETFCRIKDTFIAALNNGSSIPSSIVSMQQHELSITEMSQELRQPTSS